MTEPNTPAETHDLIVRADHLLSRPERFKRWGIGYACIILTAILVLVIFQLSRGNATLDAIRSTQLTNGTINHNTNLTAHQVKQIFTQFEDCIQPTGTCYQKGQKRTATALVGLEHVILASATCAAEPNLPATPHERQQAVSVCVAHLLNKTGDLHGR